MKYLILVISFLFHCNVFAELLNGNELNKLPSVLIKQTHAQSISNIKIDFSTSKTAGAIIHLPLQLLNDFKSEDIASAQVYNVFFTAKKEDKTLYSKCSIYENSSEDLAINNCEFYTSNQMNAKTRARVYIAEEMFGARDPNILIKYKDIN
jgi:hypothetical protein